MPWPQKRDRILDALLLDLEARWNEDATVQFTSTDAFSVDAGDPVTIGFLASTNCDYVRVQVQHDESGGGGSTYNDSTYVSREDIDTRDDKQQDYEIARDSGKDYWVFLTPVRLEQGSLVPYSDSRVFAGLGGDDDDPTFSAPEATWPWPANYSDENGGILRLLTNLSVIGDGASREWFSGLYSLGRYGDPAESGAIYEGNPWYMWYHDSATPVAKIKGFDGTTSRLFLTMDWSGRKLTLGEEGVAIALPPVYDAGDPGATWAPDYRNGPGQVASVDAAFQVDQPTNMPENSVMNLRIAMSGGHTITFDSNDFEGPTLVFTTPTVVSVSIWNNGTSKYGVFGGKHT